MKRARRVARIDQDEKYVKNSDQEKWRENALLKPWFRCRYNSCIKMTYRNRDQGCTLD